MGKPVNLLHLSILLTLKGVHPLHRDVVVCIHLNFKRIHYLLPAGEHLLFAGAQ